MLARPLTSAPASTGIVKTSQAHSPKALQKSLQKSSGSAQKWYLAHGEGMAFTNDTQWSEHYANSETAGTMKFVTISSTFTTLDAATEAFLQY